jgi:glycosyltransferase involved in cell wall biosynthesis
VVASGFMRAEYLRAGMAPDRVHAIALFAPPHLASETDPDRSRPIDVAFIGRMTPLKGPGVLLDAAARASTKLGRRISVVLAGEGPERDRLAARPAAPGVEARFPGWLEPPERDRLLREATVLAVPSVWPEPFGLVGLEAGACGTPAVGFDVGGIGEWLTDGENGRLIASQHGAAGLGDAIAGLLGDPELRRTLAAGARAAAARFSLDAYVKSLTPILQHAAAAGAAAR